MKRNKRGTGSVAVVHLSVFLVALSACKADSRAEEPQAAFNSSQETGAEDGLPKDQQALSSARLVHIANDTAAHSGVHGQIPGAKKEGQVIMNNSENHHEVDTSKLTHISGTPEDFPLPNQQSETGERGTGNQTVDIAAFQSTEQLGSIKQPTEAAKPQSAQALSTDPLPPDERQEEEDEEDRHNFALATDGAKVVAVNKEAKKAGALLDNDADTFLKNECRVDKWVIVELSQVAKMDTLLISQNELYSSRVKEFEVKGRQTHPRAEGTEYAKHLNSTGWQLLGRFNASNSKGSQAFKLERPTWIKYLQLRILNHHGTEAVCALNDVCVFGKSAAEDLEARLNLETPTDASPSVAGITTTPETLTEVVADEGVKQLLVDSENGSTTAPAAARTVIPRVAESERAEETEESGTSEPEHRASCCPELKERMISTAADGCVGQASSDTHPVVQEAAAGPDVMKTASAALDHSPASSKEAAGADHQISDPEGQGTLEEKRGPSDGQTDAEADEPTPFVEEQLPINSAGSAATRHGGSVYDVIVQELKAIKLAQKGGERILAQLHKNVTAVMGGFAFELDLLASRLRPADPLRAAIMPPGKEPSDGFCHPSRRGSGDGLDFREGQCQARVVQPPTELELLQLEVAALRELVLQSKRQVDGMLLALAFSLLGGVGISFLMGSTDPLHGSLKRTLMLLVLAPVGLVSVFWLPRKISDLSTDF